MITILCGECEKQFNVSPSRAGRSKYCCKNCYTNAQKRKIYNQHLKKAIVKNCKKCNKAFEAQNYRKDTAQFCSIRCSRLGIPPANIKENPSYSAIHHWVKLHKEKPSACEICKVSNASRYEWSNISGYYKRELSDWQYLCKKCHHKYDDISTKIWKKRKASNPY